MAQYSSKLLSLHFPAITTQEIINEPKGIVGRGGDNNASWFIHAMSFATFKGVTVKDI